MRAFDTWAERSICPDKFAADSCEQSQNLLIAASKNLTRTEAVVQLS